MNAEVQSYIDAVPEGKPLFDLLHALVLSLYPDAEVSISEQIPTYKVRGTRIALGYWKNGVSLYNGRLRINEFKATDTIPVAALREAIHRAIEQSGSTPASETQGK
jgi:hypothetical protein